MLLVVFSGTADFTRLEVASGFAPGHPTRSMRSFFLFVLGGVCGVLGTVLFFTVDPTFDTATNADGAGGGNVSLVLTEEALAGLIERELPSLPGFGQDPQVETTVGSNGVIRVDIGVGGLGVGLRSSITVNPNIVDGRLKFDVVDARLGELAIPGEVAEVMAHPVEVRLDSLAGELPYRVTSIRTTERRLTIEIEI